MIYTVTFNPALDYVIHMEELKPGKVNRTQRESLYYGGKGINVSIVLKRLGLETTAFGFLAGFTGDEIGRGLKKMGVKAEFIELEAGLSRINVKIKGKEETDINGTGPQINQEDVGRLMKKIAGIQDGDTLVLAGSIPTGLPTDIYEKILGAVKGKEVNTVVDAEKELLVKALAYHPFLIKPNHHELGEIFEKNCDTEEEIMTCVQEIQRMGARNVLVSRASEGALLADETGAIHTIPAPKGTVVNSVGAGDSMVAGFLAGYEKAIQEGKPPYELALKYGVAAGSATAFLEDLASEGQILSLLGKINS